MAMKCVVILAIILAYMTSLECWSVAGLPRILMSDLDKMMERELSSELQDDLEDLLRVLMREWSQLGKPEGEDDLPHQQQSLQIPTQSSGSPGPQSSLAHSAEREQKTEEKRKEKEIFSKANGVEKNNTRTRNNRSAASNGSPADPDQNLSVLGKGARHSAGVQAKTDTLGKIVVKSAATATEAVAAPERSALPAVAVQVPQGTTEMSSLAGAGGGRQGRQAPPNILYRRRKQPRPCPGDGTSALFTGTSAMTYISFLANVLSLVLNINNNVNNNNNNDNINSNNNIDSNNANLNINSNNANQVLFPTGVSIRSRGEHLT